MAAEAIEIAGDRAGRTAAEAIEIAGDRAGRRAAEAEAEAEYRREMRELVDLLSNLNPSAEEFVPSSRSSYGGGGGGGGGGGRRTRSGAALSAEAPVFVAPNDYYAVQMMNAWLLRDQKRKNSYSERKRRSSVSSIQEAEREDSIKRTVYISEIDRHITEEQLAALFSTCGKVIDCRICGDANSSLRFAFVEFASESKSAHGVRLSHEKADLRASLAQLQLQECFLSSSVQSSNK